MLLRLKNDFRSRAAIHYLRPLAGFLVVSALGSTVGCSSDSDSAGTETGGTGGGGTTGNGGSGGVLPGSGGVGGTGVGGNGGGGETSIAGAGAGGESSGGGQGGAGGSGGASGASGAAGAGGMAISSEGDGNVTLMQPFVEAPEMSDQQGVAKGQIVQFTMSNTTTFADGARMVAVYIPAGYVSGTEVPFMVAQDGVIPQNGGSFGLDDLRPLLDNMIAAGRLPKMAGIFVDPGGMRSVEYDTVSETYYHFVEDELLPEAISQVQTQAGTTLNLTTDPEGRGAFGGSSGGACAFTMGWFHPESYRRILTLSGSFVALKTSTDYPEGAGDYHLHLIPESDPKPLRVFLEAGTMDIAGVGGWKNANDAMAAALEAKGYHYRYVVAENATHEDDGARRQYLPEAMEWLWRGYPITP